MTEFEFLSVLISMIFGLALTQIMSGAVRSLYNGELNENQLVYTLFSILLLVLNWWVSFSWNVTASWSFGSFLILVLWAMSHYGMAVTMYPPTTSTNWPFEKRRKYYLGAFIVVVLADIAVTANRGALFSPWYYLPFVAHYGFVSWLGIYLDSSKAYRVIAWWFLFVTLTWAFVVRKLLSELV